MKKVFAKGIFLLVLMVTMSVNLFAQKPKSPDMNNYTKEWEAITKLESDGLTKSALEATEKLYEQIKKDDKNPAQTAQKIKALLFYNKYQSRLEEDGLVKAIYRFQQEAEKATSPTKPILQSIVAEMYNNYLSQHLYKFRNRTKTEEFKQEDIRTWDISRFTQKSYDLYSASIEFEDTKKIKIEDFGAITYTGRNVEGLRPTLYDFLAQRALTFFVTEKYYLTKPAFQFYLEDKVDFADAKEFAAKKIVAKDSLSTKFRTLQVFKSVLAFHLDDKDPKALIDLDLQRLEYVKSHSILKEKDALYLERLEALEKKYATNPASAEISHKIATYYYQKGQGYQPTPKEEGRWDIKKAADICKATIKKFPKSYGANHCQSLLHTIQYKMITIQTENINSPNQNILSLLNYKNIDKAYFKIIPINKGQLETLADKYNRKKIEYLNSLKSTYKWDISLKNEGDYHNHSVEIEVPKLSKGRYILAVSHNGGFASTKNAVTYTSFYVSDLSILNRQEEGLTTFYINDRKTGEPMKGVKAEIYIQRYNSLLRKYEYIKKHTTTTDANGYFKSKFFSGNGYYNNNFYLKLTHKDDELYLDNTYYNYDPSDPYLQEKTHFFLDRAIYRPGQTVYFKGLVMNQMTDGKKPELVTKSNRTITFFDANYQKVADVEVTTNDYGTFNGSFTAPTGGLLGSMQISDNNNNSSKYLRVEEYKRPKFEVIPSPIKEAFQLNDSVTVKGVAKAYAGNNIDGAKVQYRVVRQTRFPYWNWRWGWRIPYNTSPQEISFGETTTDENGAYEVTFQAVPDRSIPKESNPEFNYTVYVDVTDITGETHSKQSAVRVGYIGLDASMTIADNVNKNEVESFAINTNNLNYQFEAAQGTITIERLQTPKVAFTTRFWTKPDVWNMSKKDFKKKFPSYAYGDEDKQEYWAIDKEVLSTSFDTEKSKKLELKDIKNWEQGQYKVVLKTKDKYDNPIEVTEFFTLYDNNATQTPINSSLFLAKSYYSNTEPATTVEIDLGSYTANSHILYEIEHDKKIISREWIKTNGRTKKKITVEEKHRGNVHFHITTVQNGRYYTNGGTIHVPWSNKELNIEYSTFRDKLKPGQEEEWRIKVSGPKGEKVAAEFLAGMYDASLDAFASNYWGFNVHPSSYRSMTLSSNAFAQSYAQNIDLGWNTHSHVPIYRAYKTFNWNGFSFYDDVYLSNRVAARSYESAKISRSSAVKRKSKKMDAPSPKPQSAPISEKEEALDDSDGVAEFKSAESSKTIVAKPEEAPEEAPEDGDGGFDDVKVRTNLNETVFFYPDLMTDEDGNLIIKFTMNEALTKWKFMLMGHTKDLKSITKNKEIVTQKDLMVMPNAPRFFRENDEIYFTAKVSNMTEAEMKGTAKLLLFDAISMEPIDAKFGNTKATLDFEAKAGQSAPLVWKLNIPDNWTTAITHRVVAKAGVHSDGEESALPVLTNRMMVTETQPLPVRGKQTKKFDFKRMTEASKSSTLKHHKLTLEFTQNPAWYAIQALPYLMEYPYECTEQIFSRYYANSLASSVANSHPKVKRVFDQWKNIDTDALKSNLSKNQELKYALLEETPWVLDAQNEEVQKKNIGLLFDLNKMSHELKKARDKMAERQLANGGFSWFPGGRDSWYITQYIVEGMGHLDKLGVKDIKDDPKMSKMITKAVSYIDDELAIHYKELLKWAKRSDDEKAYLAKDNLDQTVIHYLYARTFFLDQAITNPTTKKAVAYYEGQAKTYALNKPLYMQGLLALGLHRQGNDLETPKRIVAAAKENALNSDEMGMYWKYPSGYFWYQLPIETHALMIEVFDVVAKDAQAVEDLKVWLLKAKQTTNWKTTKATAAACYSLLMNGDNWLMDDKEIDIKIGGKKLDQSKIKKEAGTGYFKTTWKAEEITPKMAKVTVKNPNNVVAWGAMYWQYFENMDKITHFKETPLKLNKKLFKQINTDRGPVLKPITSQELVPGDLIKVRIELIVDRDMEYVHMKDMRAAGLEPTNVISQYKYQGGLGYYESTRDASTNFFFSYLSKGTYVFEYPLRVNHKGDFSNGITTIQCMYAPEFTAHSEGVRVQVK